MVTVAEAKNNAVIKELLGQKVKEGYCLMEATCPKCAVPLVKNHQMVPKSLSMDESEITRTMSVEEPILVPSQSFEQPFKPVDGVPMCVGCNSHVVTCETEIAILEQGETLMDRGHIYVAMEAPAEPEIINLEDVVEEQAPVGNHRSNIVVDIEPIDLTGMDMPLSPLKTGKQGKPINLEDFEGEKKEQVDPEEQAARRELATKVLGAKMLQGWTLKEKTCLECSMPMMVYQGKESCAVCPALAKRAQKLAKAQQKIEAEEQAKQELVERTEQLETIQAIREEKEVRALKDDEDATYRAQERKRVLVEEKNRILALEANDVAPQQEETEQEDPAFEERDRARALIEEKMELERLLVIAKEEEARRESMAKANGKESEKALLETKAKQEAAAKELTEDAAAIEAIDDATIADDKTEAMKKDRMVDEHRKKVATKVAIDDEVAKLEEQRFQEALEARRIAEEKRIEEENRMIAALEADAAVKALAAEDAIRRAKAALQEVSNTKKHIISNSIKLAEKEALAETETAIMAEFERHNEPVVVQTEEEIYQERWDTLRSEGRAIMTRRVLKGWSITPDACLGCECHNSPLIEKDGVKECVVCGGCGNGEDGVYAPVEKTAETVEAEESHVPPSVAKSMAEIQHIGILDEDDDQEAKFDEMRKIYASEMGKKMLAGWKIVDASCPHCVMPLMMDDKGNSDICIVDGCKGPVISAFDASTIATKEMAELNVQQTHTDETSLASAIVKQTPNKEKKADPPAYMPGTTPKAIIPLPNDLADVEAIREIVNETREQAEPSPIVIDTVDAPASTRVNNNEYDEAETKRQPFPEKAARSPAIRQLRAAHSPREEVSVLSAASDDLDTVYDRIEQCKLKLLDPNNTIDEQIATAALLEKLAETAVAMKEIEQRMETLQCVE